MSLPTPPVIGLMHPGEMGATVGKCLTDAGHTVLWASEGRGHDTAVRARDAALSDVGTAGELASQAEVILSICPPHAALDVAWVVHGFTGLYVDANAISPGTAREVAQLITGSGGRYVDGGIIGSPPHKAGTTRLYLSGAYASEVHALFSETPLKPRIVSGPDTGASAVKMAYASWTKGTSALLLAARALAHAEGVEDALLEEWAMSQPQLAEQFRRAARSGVAKGWRWVGEMEEIALTMSGAGLPDGFHQAAAEIYRHCPRLPASVPDAQVTSAVLAALTGSPPPYVNADN